MATNWPSLWSGDTIELVHNGNVIHTFPPKFTDDKICLNADQIDEINDVFQLRKTGDDGVSFKHNQGFYLDSNCAHLQRDFPRFLLMAKTYNIFKFRFA